MASKKEGSKKTPVNSFAERIIHIVTHNYRGLIGVLVPVIILGPQLERFNNTLKLQHMWCLMLWFYLIQPVSIPVTGLVPVFLMPMGGIMNAIATCKSYMNEAVILFILTGWLISLLNNSGVDKRIAFWFIGSGDSSQYTGKNMVYKCGFAAFFLSMFSNRLIVTYTLTLFITNTYGKMAAAKKGAGNPNLITIRDIINNTIQTSSGIGSIAIVHSSPVNLLFRGCYQESAPANHEYADIFNYLQYSMFAFPVALIMFIVNLWYHMYLADMASKGEISGLSMAHIPELKRLVEKEKGSIPPDLSLHEKYAVFFAGLYLLVVIFRWNGYMEGWATYTTDKIQPTIPGCKDATVAAIFILILHCVPKGFSFRKIWSAKKKSNLPPLKPESGILWWRYIDKNINYGYIFVFGSTYALLHAATFTKLDDTIGKYSGTFISDNTWNAGILIVVIVASILCNLTTALAACSMWCPFVLLMAKNGPDPWSTHGYITGLGVGIASNFGFCIPFQYTPAYYCHNLGKVPIMTMVQYSIPTVIICAIILYIALIVYAPLIWEDHYLPLNMLAPPPIVTQSPPDAATT